MIRAIYSLLMWMMQPLLRRKLMARAVNEPGYGELIAQRFGFYESLPESQGAVWIHAVSLGETRAAAILLQTLRQIKPDLKLLLTHGTATGRTQGQTLLREGDVQVWQPWDTPCAMNRFLKQFQPRVGLLMETEVWPNWVHACQQANVPLLLVNARMSEKSLKQAQRLAWLSRPAYTHLKGVWAQTHEDAQRLIRLGAQQVKVTGNFKFDAQPDALQLKQAHEWKKRLTKPVVMFASSRETEESLWIEAMRSLKTQMIAVPCVQWMIVPRHPQRFDEVAQLLSHAGWRVLRRSQWSTLPPSDVGSQDDAPTVWLGDSLGEMALYYGLSDVALLGGSFAPLGGQNLIEAAACGCPVVMGPHTFNFEQAAQWAQDAGAAVRAGDLTQAIQTAVQIANSAVQDSSRKQACERFSRQHQGATQRVAREVCHFLQ